MQLIDLMTAGLIKEGDEFVYRRPKYGVEHTGIIDSRGHLVVDGRPFKTVSGAASALSRMQVDGWEAWFGKDSGESIAILRQKLLSSNSKDEGTAPLKNHLIECGMSS